MAKHCAVLSIQILYQSLHSNHCMLGMSLAIACLKMLHVHIAAYSQTHNKSDAQLQRHVWKQGAQ